MSKWSRVEVPFGGGMDQKVRPEALPATSFVLLQNLVQNRSGSYTKPPGYVNLPNTIDAGGTIAAAVGAFAYRDAPVILDGTNAYSYSTTEQAWHSLGVAVVPRVTRLQGYALNIGSGSASNDIAYANGYYVLASVPSIGSGVALVILDAATGARARFDQVLTNSGSSPVAKLAVMGTKVVVFYYDNTAATKLFYSVIDLTSAATIAAGATAIAQVPNITDMGLSANGILWDCTASAGNSTAYVVYENSGGTTSDVTVRSYTLSGSTLAQSASATVNTGSTTLPVSLAIGGDSTDRIWVAYQIGTTAAQQVIGLDPTALSVISTATTVTPQGSSSPGVLGVVGLGSGSGLLVYGPDAGGLYFRRFTTSGGAVSTATTTQRTCGIWTPITRPWTYNSRVYVAAMYYGQFSSTPYPQGQTYVLDITDAATDPLDYYGVRVARPVANFAQGLTTANPSGSVYFRAAHVAQNGGVATVLALVNKSSAGASNGGVSSLDLFSLDFTTAQRWKAAAVGEAVMLGGLPQYCDGKEVAEVGFSAYPEIGSVALAAGGSLAVGASYQYTAIYEYTDASGCVSWSAPATPSNSVTPTAGNQAPNVPLTYLQAYGKLGQVAIAIYRSKNGAPYQRIATLANDATKSVYTSGWTDTTSDTLNGTANPYLYTTGGAQARFAPSSLYALTAHGDRIFGVDPTGKNVWYTGQYVYGEAPWFASLFQFPVDAGGPIVGIGSMDGRVYLFKRDRIFVVDGDGPPDAGGGGYSLPAEIPCGGAGCIDARSIVTAPAGIFYQSDQGIYLLTRGNEVQYVGRAVESTVKTYGPVTSATLNAPAGRVVFTLNSASPNPTAVFYDYVHGIWSQRSTVLQYPFVAATVVGGQLTKDGASNVPVWTGAIANGFVYQESSSTFLDGGGVGSWQPSTLQTSWIKLDGQQSFSRIRELGLLAEYVSDHKLTINVFFDYSASAPQVITFSAAQIDAFTTAREQLAIRLKTQKVEAVQVQIVDAADGTTGSVGQGCNFIGLAFTVAPKSGGYRLPVNQRA